MLLTKCEICDKILSEVEIQSYNRRLMLGNEIQEPQPRCFSCVNETKNLLKG